MRVELQQNYATPTMTADPGDVVDLPESIARDLIAKRYAIPVGRDVRERHANSLPQLIIENPARDDAWTDPELLGALVERDALMRRRQERERK
jgi:hypothetical protein